MTHPSVIPPPEPAPDDPRIALCRSADLVNSGRAVGFDVMYGGQTCRAFAIRYEGKVYAYLNRCSHVAMELDWQPDRFFDDTGKWLLCATHGARYRPDSGECTGGPCRGGLVQIALIETGDVVYWQSHYLLKPVAF
ncbi:Rieske 2Fe-2S domain-containing protein [Hydrogenophaga sp. 5NK40-0174]|uniref:Rieske (2Fe-2S) protein n=1 Tax=Hydrogenophaga sp. 5NK40-0174 TaxID=3127649 RepID=UPI00310BAB5B